MNKEKTFDKIKCESCGEEFSCGAKSGKCWCFEIELKPETLIELRDEFKSCLCDDCLKIKNQPPTDTKIHAQKQLKK